MEHREMKITTQERAKVFAAYIGVTCDTTLINRNGAIISPIIGIVNNYVHFKHIDDTIHVSRLSLPLTPVERISDEDAIEVAKICDPFISDGTLRLVADMYGIKVSYSEDRYVRILFVDGSVYATHNQNLTSNIGDFLRSRSYNIGYGKYSAADLVEAGVVKYEAI